MSEPAAESPRPAAGHRDLSRRIAGVVVAAAGTGLLLAVVGGFGGRLAWWLDLLTHLRPILGLALIACVLLQALARPQWPAAIWGTGAALAIAPLLPYWLGDQSAAPAEPLGRLVHANLGHNDLRIDEFVAWVDSERPEVLSLQEVTPVTLPQLEEQLVGYDLVIAQPREDTRGVALFVASDGLIRVEARVIVPTPDPERPMVEAIFTTGDGRELAFLGFHTTRPTASELHGIQRAGMRSAAQWAGLQQLAGRDVIVVGDFNSTGQSALVAEMCRAGGLSDLRRGNGWKGTWPSAAPVLFRLPIDGGYATRGLVARDVRVGSDVGSDHRPLLYDLWISDAPVPEMQLPESHNSR